MTPFQSATAAIAACAVLSCPPVEARLSSPTPGAAKPGTSEPKKGEKPMTRDELRECMKLEARVKEDNQALRARQRDTDAAKDEIAKRTSALRERVAGLDRSDAAAVESAKSEGEDIDRASDRYNAGLPDLDRRTRAAAAQQADWKARCSGKPYDERDYYAIKRGK